MLVHIRRHFIYYSEKTCQMNSNLPLHFLPSLHSLIFYCRCYFLHKHTMTFLTYHTYVVRSRTVRGRRRYYIQKNNSNNLQNYDYSLLVLYIFSMSGITKHYVVIKPTNNVSTQFTFCESNLWE